MAENTTAKERVEQELADLKIKYLQLHKQLQCPDFCAKFNSEELSLLNEQLSIQQEYIEILNQRLLLWREV